jgi:hypothetical protein
MSALVSPQIPVGETVDFSTLRCGRKVTTRESGGFFYQVLRRRPAVDKTTFMTIMFSMEPHQRWQYKLSLDLKIRNAYGTAFQDFFSTVMEKLHGDDFVRVRPWGSLGDKGCDGYLSSNGQVFQCYGKLEDAPVNSASIVEKLGDDYSLAARNLTAIMKEWHFAHNLVNGLPTDAVLKIQEMRTTFPDHQFGVVGPAGLEERVFKLSEHHLLELLGPVATAEDSRNLRMDEVRDLVDAVMNSIDAGVTAVGEIRPVPRDKLVFNNLPLHWSGLIAAASQNAPHVKQYFDRHPKPETGEMLAKVFAERYTALKQESVPPGVIMDQLYEQVTGMGSVSAQRQVAAQALLAYLFDACEIFEDHPSKVA